MFGCFEWSPILLVDTLPYFDGKIYISSILAYILTTDKTNELIIFYRNEVWSIISYSFENENWVRNKSEFIWDWQRIIWTKEESEMVTDEFCKILWEVKKSKEKNLRWTKRI